MRRDRTSWRVRPRGVGGWRAGGGRARVSWRGDVRVKLCRVGRRNEGLISWEWWPYEEQEELMGRLPSWAMVEFWGVTR